MENLIYPLLGGVLIGIAATGLMLFNGRIMGVSGILGGALRARSKDLFWRMAFLAGVILGGVLIRPLGFSIMELPVDRPLIWVALGGILVGFGTSIGSGCTSGHGVCGLARLSKRSLVATMTFIFSGVIAVAILKQMGIG